MVEIKFDYRFASEDFFTEEAKTALETAGKIWSNLLQDDFENIPAGAEFTVQNPVTGANEEITLQEEVDDIVIFVGASDNPFGGQGNNTTGLTAGDTHLTGCCCTHCHASANDKEDLSEYGILNSSNVGLLAQAKVDGTDLQGDLFQRRIASNFRDTGAVTDFEPWAGVIAFSTVLPQNTDWNFSLNNPDPENFDFISVALHEIGHVLGVGVAPIFNNLIENGSFNGENAKNINNNQGIPFESGHIEEGFANDETLLDSILGDGRISPTDLDLALLADIGYEINGFTKQGFVPEIATEGDELIIGASIDNVLNGLAGDDEIQGKEGEDSIQGGSGEDTIFGDIGQDSLLGNEGNDEIQGNQGNDTLEGGAGNDSIFGNEGNDLIFGDAGNDTLQGGAGDDTVRGNDDNDLLQGQDGNDFLLGNSGEDELQGGEGNDNLRGGDANDTLFGQDGNDTVEGGTSDDILIGGAGGDRFDFGFDFGNDTINDYIVSEDSLRFSAKYNFATQSYNFTSANEIIGLITNTGNSRNSEQIFTEITLDENKVTIFHDVEITADEIDIYQPFQSLLEVTNSGFEIQFNQNLNLNILNLYEQGNQIPDISFIRNSTGENIDGSLIWNEDDLSLTFVKTNGILEADTYSLTLFSRENGFVSADGELLDGDNDGIEGDNFLLEFEVAGNEQRVINVEDISRGIGQNITNSNTNEGLTISLDNGSEITQIDFTLTYDAAILNLNDIVLNSDLVSDWTITKNLDTPGTAEISLLGTTALDSGAIDLLQLDGAVSTTAEYGTGNLLRLEDISLNQGNVQAIGDDGLLKVTNLGDANGDANYSSLDALLISEIAAGIDSSLDSFSTTDTIIISDVNGDGVISAFDAYIVNQEANGVNTSFL